MTRELESLPERDHIVHFYREDDRRIAILIPFLKGGLERGQRGVCVVDAPAAKGLTRALGDSLGVRPGGTHGPLVVMTDRECRRAGEFDPGALLERIRDMEEAALAAGFSGLRLALDTGWALGGGVGPLGLVQWESLASSLFSIGRRVTAICQYDLRRFSAAILRRQLRTHPKLIVGDRLYANLFFYEPPEDSLGEGADERLFDRMIGQLQRARASEEVRAELIREQAARSAAETARRRAEFLAQAAAALGSALDCESILQRVARLALPVMADWCLVDLTGDEITRGDEATARRVAIAHEDPVRVRLAWEASRRFPVVEGERHPIAAALRTGEPALFPEISDDLVRAMVGNDQERRVLRAMRLESAMIVPLRSRGRTLGAITLATAGSGRRYGHEDLASAEEFGFLIALALDNARLFEEAKRRRQEAESLADLGRLISGSLDLTEVGQRVVEGVRHLLRVQSAALFRLDHTSQAMVLLVSSEDKGPASDDLPALPKGTGLVGLAMAGRRPVATANILTDPRIVLTPAERARFEQSPFRAALAAPLLLQDQAVGALRVHDVEGRTFGDDDIGLLGAFADHAALAIQNSRLYAEANEAATTRERVRLAQELHDALSQMLFSVGLKLDQCAQQPGGNSALRAKLEEIRRDAGCMMGQLRQILSHLASDGPAERPSGRELRALVEQFRDMTGTAVDYREVGDVRRIDAPQWEILYRLLQEALVNIAKHARASRAAVRLEVGTAEVLLEVADEGVGPPAWLDQENVLDRGPHFGLRQMRERFQRAGGRLEYGADDPLGFRLRGRLPLSQRPRP